jgi:hypothetical protein
MEFKTNYLPPSVQYWPSEDENNRAHIDFIKKDIIASLGEKNRNSGKNISNTILQKKQKTDSTPTLPFCIQ